MKSSLYHIQINIANKKSLPFYKSLFAFFDYKIIDESPKHIGLSNGTTDFWIIQVEKKYQKKKFHRKYPGLNHLAFRVQSRQAVEDFTKKFLQKNKIKTLYNSPKPFPEYTKDYYAVFFEDPERIKWEVAYRK